MPFFGAHPQRRADHAAHGRLKGDRCRLVEGADDHRRQKSVDLLVDHVYRQSVTIRYTVRVSASVFESPRAPVEVHRYRTLVTERRSEEHTSELQSRENLVCRLLLEKKKKAHINSM